MSTLKFILVSVITIISIQAYSNSIQTNDYSFLSYDTRGSSDQCVNHMFQLLSNELNTNNFEYRVFLDKTDVKTEISFPKAKPGEFFNYYRTIEIEIDRCNSNFSFIYNLKNKNSCLDSDQFQHRLDNFNKGSCLDLEN